MAKQKKNLGWSTMEIEIVNGIAPAPPLRRNDTFRFFTSDRNITDLIAESITHKTHNAAKNIGINKVAVRYIRKLIIINKHHMAEEDRAKLQYCFDTLNAERSLVHVRLIGNKIIEKYWKKSKPRKEERIHDTKKFDRAIIALREVCETVSELNIPFGYSTEQVRDARSKVDAARKALNLLRNRLDGKPSNDGEDNE